MLDVNQPDPTNLLDVLAKVGGFEIGGIACVILASCAHQIPVVVDGFISTAGALLAAGFHPHVKDYLFSGHQSAVEGHRRMLDALALSPLLDLGMRIGEGTGAALVLSLLSVASRISTEMLTFEEACVQGRKKFKTMGVEAQTPALPNMFIFPNRRGFCAFPPCRSYQWQGNLYFKSRL